MRIDYSNAYIYKLHAVTSVLDKAFDVVLKRYSSVTFSQLNILLTIQQFEGDVSQHKISTFLEITPSAVSRQVENCQIKGWVSVNEVDGNRREQHVRLTKGGQKALNKAVAALEEHVFSVFYESSQSLDLAGHLDHLLLNTKGVLLKYSRSRNETNLEEEDMAIQIPKARVLFRGDINDAVIKVQKATGIHITPSWWNSNVGNDGSTDSILDRFDKAYAIFVEQQTK